MELSNFGEDILEEHNNQKKKRPTFLLVLCILTLVYAGLSVFTPIAALFQGPQSPQEMEMVKRVMTEASDKMQEIGSGFLANFYNQMYEMLAQVNENHYLYYLMVVLYLGMGIAGAIFMLKGKKLGFHLYLGYSALATFGPYLFVSTDSYPMVLTITNLIISGIFILMYSRNLKHLS
jgi:hypothetical protein